MERHFVSIQNAFEEDMNQYLLKAKKIIHPIDEIKSFVSASVEKNILSDFIVEQIYQYALLGRISDSYTIMKMLKRVKPQKEIIEYNKLYEISLRFGEIGIAETILDALLEKCIKQQKVVLLYRFYIRHQIDIVIPKRHIPNIEYILGIEQSLVRLEKEFVSSKLANVIQNACWKKSLESYEKIIEVLIEEEQVDKKFTLAFMYEYLLNSQSTPLFNLSKFKTLWEKVFSQSTTNKKAQEEQNKPIPRENYKYDLTVEEKKQMIMIRNMDKKDLIQYSSDLFVNYINVEFLMAAELVVDICLEEFVEHLTQEKIINLYFLKIECLERRMLAVDVVELSAWCLDNLELTPYEESLFNKIKKKNLGRIRYE